MSYFLFIYAGLVFPLRDIYTIVDVKMIKVLITSKTWISQLDSSSIFLIV